MRLLNTNTIRHTTYKGYSNSPFAIVENLLISILNPPICINCGYLGSYFCKSCMFQLSYQEIQKCVVCNKPSLKGKTHASCTTSFTPEFCYRIYTYSEPLKTLLHTAKFEPYYYSNLKYLTQSFLQSSPDLAFNKTFQGLSNPVITFAPSNASKLKSRGFHPAEVIANEASRNLHIICDSLLEKTKETASQADLDRKNRLTNLSTAFICLEDISGKDIVLFDDVCTTGATFLECSKVLKRAGARAVYCFSLAG